MLVLTLIDIPTAKPPAVIDVAPKYLKPNMSLTNNQQQTEREPLTSISPWPILQKVIREEFKQCTVITIAHRLDTILDSDFILVMNNGSVTEFAPPQELLSDESSCFFKLLNGLEAACDAPPTITRPHCIISFVVR